MDTATLDAPAVIPEQTFVSGEDTTPQEQSAFKDIFSTPPDTPVKEAPKKESKKNSEAMKPKQDDVKKPDAAKTEDKPASKWDRLENLKKPEVKDEAEVESQSTEEVDTEKEPDPKAGEPQTRWKELKAVESAAKKSETVDDILKIPSLSEKAKSAIQALKTELEGYKTNGHIPEETKKRVEWLEQRFANETLDSDPGFQREVLAPIQNSWSRLGKIAQDAGLDDASAEAFRDAITNRDEVSRALAINRILSNGKVMDGEDAVPLADNVIAILNQKATAIADALHEQYWPKEVQYRQKATEIANAIKAKDSKETEAESKARVEEYGKEAARLSEVIKERMPLVFEQHPDALEAILAARPSKEIADQVFDAQSGHLVNFMAKTLNSTLEKLAKLEASLKARDKARPNLSGNGTTTPKREDSAPSFDEVFGRR